MNKTTASATKHTCGQRCINRLRTISFYILYINVYLSFSVTPLFAAVGGGSMSKHEFDRLSRTKLENSSHKVNISTPMNIVSYEGKTPKVPAWIGARNHRGEKARNAPLSSS